jgi:myo-inositol-1(or 4)-monophosphatase
MNRVPVIGVVFNPFTSHLYSGIKGRGSYLTDLNSNSHNVPTSLAARPEKRRLPLMPASPLTGLNSCLVAVEWGSDRAGQNMDCKLTTFANLAKSKDEGGAMVHSLRSLGSAALNLCAVAAGHIDVYWEGGCYAWDVCAGWCILSEAGGVVVDANPGGWRIGLDQRRYLGVRGDGEGKSEEEQGLKMSGGQKGVIEELWACVPKGGFDYEAPR